jgi:hypothetical protein
MMKFRSSLIALAALAAIGSAHALTPSEVVAERTAGNLKEIKITGASALRLALGGFIQADLAQPGTLDVFYNNAAGNDHRAYSFRLNTAIGSWAVGTPVLITKRDLGGSGQGVGPLITAEATQLHMKVDAACTVNAAGTSPATDIQKPGFFCSGTVAGLADAGLSDVEPALLEATINAGNGRSVTNLDSEGFVQNIFGVAVNKKLYLALQKAQGLVATSATVVDEDAAKQPSLPIPFVRGALTGQLLGNDATTKKGWNLVVPTSVDAAVFSKKINVCRRTAGSGTQAASNAFFANNPCGGGDVYIPSVAGGSIGATGALAVVAGSSTGAVETCLGTTAQNAAGDAYALGVIGRENNPLAVVAGVPTDKGYRFVKLSGVAPERANVINSSYEFVVESTMQWAKTGANAPAGEKLDLLKLLRGNMGKATVLAGLDVDFQAGLAASPSTIVGTWADLSPAVQAFTSHSSRKAAASCTPVRMAK